MPNKTGTTLIFIRHGLSQDKVDGLVQGSDSHLSALGINQILGAAEQVARYAPKALLCSPLTRGLESAEIIGRRIGLTPQIVNGLREIKRPDDIEGKSKKLPLVEKFRKEWSGAINNADVNWQFELDGSLYGEPFAKFIPMVNSTIQDAIYRYRGQSVAIVGHSVHFAFALSRLFLGQTEAPVLFALARSFFLPNSGIAVVEYLPKEGRWALRRFDDNK